MGAIGWWRYGFYRVVVLYVAIRWWRYGCFRVVAPWVL